MAASLEQRNRPDFSNPADIAVEVSELKGAFALLQAQNNGAIQNLTGSVQALQAEIRNVGKKVEEVTRLQVHQEAHSEGLARAFKAIGDLAESTRAGFEQQRENIDAWRVQHVRDNNDTRDKVMRFSGVALVVSTVAGLMVGVVMWYSDKVDAAASGERTQTELTLKDNSARIRSIEYYLSQGGSTPDKRYSPK